jgi:hypothetical protein
LIAAGTARPTLAARTTRTTAGTALATGSAPAAGSSTLFRSRRASLLEGLSLLRRQDPIKLGLGFLFELGELLLLVFRKVQLLDDERREQMESAGRTTGAARSTGSIPARRSTGTTAARTVRGTVLRGRSHGNGGNGDDAENHGECQKTSHGGDPS